MRTRFLALLLALLCATSIAQTDPTSREQRARAVIDRLFDDLATQLQIQLANSAAIQGYSFQRDYQLQQTDDGRYSAVIETLSIDTIASRINLAPLTVVIDPQPEQTAALALTLPERIEMRSLDDSGETATLAIGGQNLQGVWSERYGILTGLSGRLDELSLNLNADGEPGQMTIAALDISHQLTIAADQSWQQASALRGSEFAFSAGDGAFAAAGMDVDVTGNGADIVALIEQGRQLQQLQIDAGSAEQLQQMALQPLLDLFRLDSSFNVVTTLRDFSLSGQGQPLGGASSVGFGLSFGAEQNQGKFAYWFDLQGLTLGPMLPLPLPPSLIPHQARIEVAASQISQALLDGFVGMLQQELQTADTPDPKPATEPMPNVLALQQLLVNNPIKLTVNDTYLRAADAGLEFSAAALSDPNAALGGAGELQLQVRGLPTLLAATGLDQNPQIAPMIGMFSAFAERSEQNGATVDRLNLSLSPQGQVLLNGKDVSGMFGLVPGG